MLKQCHGTIWMVVQSSCDFESWKVKHQGLNSAQEQCSICDVQYNSQYSTTESRYKKHGNTSQALDELCGVMTDDICFIWDAEKCSYQHKVKHHSGTVTIITIIKNTLKAVETIVDGAVSSSP